MFVSGYNQGLEVARDALSAPLIGVQAPEVDSNSDKVRHREDDNPLPKNPFLYLLHSRRLTLLGPL